MPPWHLRLIAPADTAWLRDYRNKTVVVTGATGFLGGRLVHRLAQVSCRIVRVARTVQLPLEPPPGATVIDVDGDLRHRSVWDRVLADADVVVHFAAQTSAAAADENPAWDFEANVAPMRHLLAACRQLGRRPTVVFAGTVTQTGVPSHLPVDEDAPDDPVTVYDQHKLMAERELKMSVSDGTVRGATLRLANIYGPGGHARSGDRDVLNRMIRAAVRGETLTVFGAGEYVRDYLFVDDAVDAFLMAGVHADRVNGRHYVVGSGSGITIRNAFELVAARVGLLTGRQVRVTTTEPARPLSDIERRSFVADPSRFSGDTGWHPNWDLSDGIDRTIEACACE